MIAHAGPKSRTISFPHRDYPLCVLGRSTKLNSCQLRDPCKGEFDTTRPSRVELYQRRAPCKEKHSITGPRFAGKEAPQEGEKRLRSTQRRLRWQSSP